MGDDDRPGWVEREKKSFAELDRLRRERRSTGEPPPRSPADPARAREAARRYKKQLDGLFQGGRAGEAERLGRALRDARGTPALAEACRAYREALGLPQDPALLACFLDAGEGELVLPALEALRKGREQGRFEPGRGLRAQLELLTQHDDDAVAEAAEELLRGY